MANFKRIVLDRFSKVFWRFFSYQLSNKKRIYLISHMRSGSSMLSNMILSNHEVFGIGESHVRYKDQSDLLEFVLSTLYVNRNLNRLVSSRFFFDKILHNHLDKNMPSEILGDSRFIFLTRDFDSCMVSTQKMFEKYGGHQYSSPAEYMRSRIIGIEGMWHKVKADNRIHISYDDIVDSPEKTLTLLSEFLGFSISQKYELGSYVGKTAIGDFSSKIKSGQILSNRKSILNDPHGEYEVLRVKYNSLIESMT